MLLREQSQHMHQVRAAAPPHRSAWLLRQLACTGVVALAFAAPAHADIIYSAGTFASQPNSVQNQPINTVRNQSADSITSVSSIAPGNWFGAQHGITFDQSGWYLKNGGAGPGTVYYSGAHRAAVTQFVGLDVAISNVTSVTANVGTGENDPSDPLTNQQRLAFYIAPSAGQTGTWYVSTQEFASYNPGFSTAGNTFTFDLSQGFYSGPADGITPADLVGGATVSLPTTGVLLAAGIFSEYTPTAAYGPGVLINAFEVDGTVLPEPTTAIIVPALAALGLARVRRRSA